MKKILWQKSKPQNLRETEEELLLNTHDDLASFVTVRPSHLERVASQENQQYVDTLLTFLQEYRKTRNGKLSPAFKKGWSKAPGAIPPP